MAEKTAHLAITTATKPSIFEYVAQESLGEVLYPATKKIVDVFYERYPQIAICKYWFEELYLCSNSLLQYYYLKNYGSSFSESFYGLQRVSINNPSRNFLSRKEILLSVATLSIFNYVKNKLNIKADELYFSDVPANKKLWKNFILKLNSFVQISIQIANFVQHMRYLSGKSDINSPILWLAGVRLKYREAEDNEEFTIRNFLPILLQKSFEVSAFFLQFYQWWQPENSHAIGKLPAPPPPKDLHVETEAPPSGVCPLCRKQRVVDTALSVSGFVFCFACINSYVRRNLRCPVTSLPATFQDLIRIYRLD